MTEIKKKEDFEHHCSSCMGLGIVSECVPLKKSPAEHRAHWVAAHWWTIAAVRSFSTPYAHTFIAYMLSVEEVIGGHQIKEPNRKWWKTQVYI